MKVRNLTLILTLRCPAECAHCVTRSSPERRDEMNAELARYAVEEAGELNLSLVLSGGEPMMRAPLVYDLARRARRFGVSIGVYTNGFWAKTPDKASTVVERLADAGVDTVLASTDAFHTDYVDAACVENACRAALAAGLRAEVAVPMRANDGEGAALLQRLEAIDGLLVKTHGIGRTGRAEDLDSTVFRFGAHDRPCNVIGQLALMPDGMLYACCAASIHFGPDSPLAAGRFLGGDLARLVSRLQTKRLLTDIQKYGPLRVALREGMRDPGFMIAFRDRYSDICDACRHLCEAQSRRLPADPANDSTESVAAVTSKTDFLQEAKP